MLECLDIFEDEFVRLPLVELSIDLISNMMSIYKAPYRMGLISRVGWTIEGV